MLYEMQSKSEKFAFFLQILKEKKIDKKVAEQKMKILSKLTESQKTQEALKWITQTL